MSYCLAPNCPSPENSSRNERCQGCGSKLFLRDRYCPIQVLWRCQFGVAVLAQDVSLPGSPYCVIRQLRLADLPAHIVTISLHWMKQEIQTLAKAGKSSPVPRLLDYFEINQAYYIVQQYDSGFAQQSPEYGSLFGEIGKLLE